MTQVIDRAMPGWKVVGSDDKEIGEVKDLGANYLEVSKGLLFPKTLYVPHQYVEREDDADERVYLRVGKDVVDTMGWDQPPGGVNSDDDRIDGGGGSDDNAYRMPH